MSEPSNTLEELFEFMAQKINAAQGPMPERDRAMLITDAVYQAAFFCLAVCPTTGHHQAFLATELLKRLRNFHSPYFVVAREMGDDATLRQLLEGFLTATDGWDATHH